MKLYYKIADFYLLIDNIKLNSLLLHNYAPFRVQEEEVSSLLFSIRFEELPDVKGIPTRSIQFNKLKLNIYLNDKRGCDIIAHSEVTGKEYRLNARNYWTNIQTNLIFDTPETYEVLDYFIMMAFIYSSSFCDTILIHASSISCGDNGVAFLGQSGIGKSTHSSLWLTHIKDTELLNDDQPAIRVINEINYLYGTPWSGKTPCYKNKRTQLNALFFLEQANENRLTTLPTFAAFQQLLSSCSMMQEERQSFNCIVKTLVSIAENIVIYKFKNRPEKAAAELAYAHSLKEISIK